MEWQAPVDYTGHERTAYGVLTEGFVCWVPFNQVILLLALARDVNSKAYRHTRTRNTKKQQALQIRTWKDN